MRQGFYVRQCRRWALRLADARAVCAAEVRRLEETQRAAAWAGDFEVFEACEVKMKQAWARVDFVARELANYRAMAAAVA